MSPTDPRLELVHLLAADLGRRCAASCRGTGLTHAGLEETVDVPGAEAAWHVQASYSTDDGLVHLDGHQHVEAAPGGHVFFTPFGTFGPQRPEVPNFHFVMPSAWLPAPGVPRTDLCGLHADPEDPTAMRGTHACGLRAGHDGPHSWQARESSG